MNSRFCTAIVSSPKGDRRLLESHTTSPTMKTAMKAPIGRSSICSRRRLPSISPRDWVAMAIQPSPRATAKRLCSVHAVARPRNDRFEEVRIRSVQCRDQVAFLTGDGEPDTGIDDDIDESQPVDEGVVVLVLDRHHRLAVAHERLHVDRDLEAVGRRIVARHLFDAGFRRAPGRAFQQAVLEIPDLVHARRVDGQHPHPLDVRRGARRRIGAMDGVERILRFRI